MSLSQRCVGCRFAVVAALPAWGVSPGRKILANDRRADMMAQDQWPLIRNAGAPRHTEVMVVVVDPADAALNDCVFRLMGWPDVKVWVDRHRPGQALQSARAGAR